MKPKSSLFLLVILSLLTIACNHGDQTKQLSNSKEPQAYSVFELIPQNIALESHYPAVLEGQQNVDIRPIIDGFIEKIFVDEGATVKKGQALFAINAPQYEQAVRTASAAIESAEAEVNVAKLQYDKTKPLVDKDIISKFDLESAALALTAKQAALTQAKAALSNAKTNLSYTVLRSPVNGVIGNIPYKVGALVSANSAMPLTTVSNIENIYAYFSLNEKQLLSIARDYEGPTLEAKIKQIANVSLVLADGSAYPEKGKIETVSGQINSQTGSARLRAIFSNANGLLRSGSSAAIIIPKNVENALVIPQKSTSDIQGKKFIYLLSDSGAVKNTSVEIMDVSKGNFYVVTSGLKLGDKVVLEGSSTLKDGVKIKPVIQPADSVYAELNQ